MTGETKAADGAPAGVSDSTQLLALRRHIGNCPLGFIQYLDAPSKLLLGRDRTESEVVLWLKDLHEIAGLEVIDLKANALREPHADNETMETPK